MATAQQTAMMYYALNKVLVGEMPIPSYTRVHRNAKLSTHDIDVLKRYVTNRSPHTPIYARTLKNEKKDTQACTIVTPSPNGIPYIPDYRNWKAISTTDRFDNGSIRIIFANDVAEKAIQAHQTNPWPDGAIFAKTAWKKEADSMGNVYTGDFIQVEFMIKDSKKYVKTKGWGWARWR